MGGVGVGQVLVRGLTLGVLVFVWGCGGGVSERRVKEAEPKGVAWKLRWRTVQSNTYSKEGLLDNSYVTMYSEVGGQMHSVKSVKQRQYEGRRLVDEKEFTTKEDGERYLSGETIRKYDAKGNKIAETQKMEGKTIYQNFRQYNDKGQVVQQLGVFRPMGSQDAGDSATSIFIYDARGHQISAIVTDQMEVGRKVIMTLYNGADKQWEFQIGPEGDTLEKYRFERDGELVKKISLLPTRSGEDTTWYRGEQIVKSISHMALTRRKIRIKDVYQYDEKGNETASFSYEAPL